MLIFSDNKEDKTDLWQNTSDFTNMMTDTLVEVCAGEDLELFLSNYLKFDYNKLLHNAELLHQRILPDGVTVRSSYLEVGNKYVTSIIAHAFPAYVPDLLFADLFSYGDTVVTMDVISKPKDDTKKELEVSMNEVQSRSVLKNSSAEEINNYYELEDLSQLFTAVERGNESIVNITLRFFLSADNLAELNVRTEKFKKTLEDAGIYTHIPVNELEAEYRGLTKPHNIQLQPCPVIDTFTRQFPYYYQSLMDESGSYAGVTNVGGQVILNTFKKTNTRVSFDILLLGVKGSGKSASLKAMVQDLIALGHKIMIIDIDREYGKMAERFGGKVIRLGKSNMINPLEIRRMVDKESEGDEGNDMSNFATEISRIETFMYQYIPSLSDIECEEFKDLLQETYEQKGIDENTDLTKLTPNDFPIFSDVLSVLRKRLYKVYNSKNDYQFSDMLSDKKKEILEQLETYLKQLSEGVFAPLFNGHSCIDINNEDFIIFDVQDLAEMGDKVYNAQLFNILSLIWNVICDNRIQNKRIKNEYDRRFAVAVIDEAHRFINARNPQALDFIEKLTRRARKYDAGLWFASQSILDFMPEGQTEGIDKVKTIFALVQYKLLMKQPESSFNALRDTFKQFTESEIASTATFEAGETLMSLGSGREKIRFCRYIEACDFAYFGGGREESEALK